MSTCRVCASENLKKVLRQESPCVTSIKTLVDTGMQVYHCNFCNHVQVENSIDLANFYDDAYDISLESINHDQLHKDETGQYVDRTKLQSKILAYNIPIKKNNFKVLEFGSGKGTTLKHLTKICDVDPYVFDVSKSYESYWDKWVPKANQSTYKLPKIWKNKFDMICMHYVLEHVPDPVKILKDLSQYLNKNGVIYFCVPDFHQNMGDLFVVDHINKFTSESLDELARVAGYEIQKKSRNELDNAYLCILRPGKREVRGLRTKTDSILKTQKFIENNKLTLSAISKKDYGERFAVFGAGFYGTLLASLKEKHVECFLDNNIHLQGENLLGKPIYAPDNCPNEIRTIVFAVNPSKLQEILDANIEKFSPGINLIAML